MTVTIPPFPLLPPGVYVKLKPSPACKLGIASPFISCMDHNDYCKINEDKMTMGYTQMTLMTLITSL